MTRTAKVFKDNDIPPTSSNQLNQDLNYSDWYFCIAKSITGETRKTLCSYDFTRQGWTFLNNGIKKLIEYYQL